MPHARELVEDQLLAGELLLPPELAVGLPKLHARGAACTYAHMHDARATRRTHTRACKAHPLFTTLSIHRAVVDDEARTDLGGALAGTTMMKIIFTCCSSELIPQSYVVAWRSCSQPAAARLFWSAEAEGGGSTDSFIQLLLRPTDRRTFVSQSRASLRSSRCCAAFAAGSSSNRAEVPARDEEEVAAPVNERTRCYSQSLAVDKGAGGLLKR